jgi:DNA-binding NarL/FixJ family response regulator
MPVYEEKGIHSGEDLAKLIMELMPNCKIILLTMYTELLKIKNIIDTINPAGLVIKNDLTFDELLFGFDIVLKDEIYYSHSVIKMANQNDNNIEGIDQFDKLILFHISKGTKTKDIPQYIPISLHAIESRKVNLKELFKIEDGSDIDLIREAKVRGIIF